MTDEPNWICPACGYDKLEEEPWSSAGSPSDQICPSCGIHFGYDDVAGGDAGARASIYVRWRADWRSRGCPWFSTAASPPASWDPCRQLKRVASR